MKVVHLPIVTSYTPLDIALKAMRFQQRSAILRESHLSLDLIEVPDVFTGMVHQVRDLSTILVSKPVHRLSQMDISTWKLNPSDPMRTELEFQTFLNSAGHLYAFIDSFLGTALMVTQRETDGERVEEVPSQCQCRGPHRHGFPFPHVSHGQPCPDCQAMVDCF